MRVLERDAIRGFYNRYGKRLDKDIFYEGRAMEELSESGEFKNAYHIVEFGCGTCRLAERLFLGYLPEEARYTGIDFSTTMVDIARKRLEPWKDRAEVILSDGSIKLDLNDRSYDRFISTYVLDILDEGEIKTLLKEAYRVLSPDGLLCLLSLTYGETFISRLLSGLWMTIYRIRPLVVGGCRPIRLTLFIDPDIWEIRVRRILVSYGISSELIIARPRD